MPYIIILLMKPVLICSCNNITEETGFNMPHIILLRKRVMHYIHRYVTEEANFNMPHIIILLWKRI